MIISELSKRGLLYPKYWLTWTGLLALRTLHYLPFKIQLGIGRTIGRLGFILIKQRAHIAQRNLVHCFPDYSTDRVEALVKKHFEAIGMGIFEAAMSIWGSDSEIAQLGTIEGLEHLQNAQAENKGVVLITGHFTPMELGGHILAVSAPVGAMYKPMKNKLMDFLVERSRKRRLNPVITNNDIRSMLKALKDGKVIWYGFDQDYGKKHRIFAKFFGSPAATITSTSRFAKSGNALVIPFFPIRLAGGTYRIKILPALEDFPSNNVEHDTQRLNDMLEKAIMDAPEQYFWMHRRFKTRPEGYPTIY